MIRILVLFLGLSLSFNTMGRDDFLYAETSEGLLAQLMVRSQTDILEKQCHREKRYRTFPRYCIDLMLQTPERYRSAKAWERDWKTLSSLCLSTAAQIESLESLKRWLLVRALSPSCRALLEQRKLDLEYIANDPGFSNFL